MTRTSNPRRIFRNAAIALTLATVASPALAAEVEFEDPTGDDNGPGSYVYPTDAVYKRGSFDLTGLHVREKGNNIEITVKIAAPFEDPWDSKSWPSPGHGFSVQMFQVYIDTDGKKGSGEADALPGMNATFAPDARWEKVVIISPQSNKTISGEVKRKAKKVASKVVLPKSVKVRGKEVTAVIPKSDLKIDIKKSGFQVLVSSNEGFPKGRDILSRKVNEYEGAHRFGGGDDSDVDPHFLDVLAGAAKGGAGEAKAQHKMLKYDAAARKKAVLTMVRR